VAKYLLSLEAAQSIASINEYTIENFGIQQAARYLKNFRDRFDYLVKNPELGTKRDDISPGFYSYYEGSHTIYYKILGGDIGIIDVLHQSMEPERNLLF